MEDSKYPEAYIKMVLAYYYWIRAVTDFADLLSKSVELLTGKAKECHLDSSRRLYSPIH